MQKKVDNIFLVGLMGAGKTSVGRLLSKRLSMPFFDSDLVIEDKTGVTVMVIFDIEGESGFRVRESKVINELTKKRGIVLATGGGVILSEFNRNSLKNNGMVIYLHAKVAELCRRTKNDNKRPLLKNGNLHEKFEELYLLRDPMYRSVADVVVDTRNQSVSDLVSGVIRSLPQEFLRGAEK